MYDKWVKPGIFLYNFQILKMLFIGQLQIKIKYQEDFLKITTLIL